jgi:hypothetical protein
MEINTHWVKPPTAIGGLDHLGTQGPCLAIYAQLLPGITNVTDRARYYSLYPWVVWSFDQRFPTADADNFVEYFRRSDCLFTLISERHSRQTDRDPERHGIAMVGRIQLLQALDRLEGGEELQLSIYTDRTEGNTRRYFMNRLGGLGQYYAGTLAQLELMDPSARPWMKFTIERGRPMSEAVAAEVPGDRFWDLVEADRVTLADLDGLSQFCACSISAGTKEHESLTDIFFDRVNAYGALGEQRRQSMTLILHLANSLHAQTEDDLTERVFRAATYSGVLSGGVRWEVPSVLEETRRAWAIYERNDLLSVVMQSVFVACLDTLASPLDIGQSNLSTVEAFAASLAASDAAKAAYADLSADSFGALCRIHRESGPELIEWEDPKHEFQLAAALQRDATSSPDIGLQLNRAFRALALLSVRESGGELPYGALPIGSDELLDSPINLQSIQARFQTWQSVPLQQVAEDLFAWCMNTHLRVALRKLRHGGQSTFRFRPTERGLQLVDIPEPAATTPRFRQAVQILRDIGALTRDASELGRRTRLSPLGTSLLEAYGG